MDTGPAGLIKPTDMKFVSKRWGWESHICNNDVYCGKQLFIKQGHFLSYHSHFIKDEVLLIFSGRIWMTYDIDGVKSIEMTPGYAFHVTPGIKHQMHAIEDTVIFEFSTTDRESDSYRTTTDLVVSHEPDGK